METSANPPDHPQQPHSSQQSARHIALSYSGPLPPPGALEAYEKIQPGAADRIIKMAEGQVQHRQMMEKIVVESITKNERTGMWFAFMLTGILMITGGALLLLGRNTAGYFAVFGPVVFHAGNYLYSRRHLQQKEENEEAKD